MKPCIAPTLLELHSSEFVLAGHAGTDAKVLSCHSANSHTFFLIEDAVHKLLFNKALTLLVTI